MVANLGVYELAPGFAVGLIAAVIVTLVSKKPSAEVEALYDQAMAYTDSEE